MTNTNTRKQNHVQTKNGIPKKHIENEALYALQTIVDSFEDELSMRDYYRMEPNEIFAYETAKNVLDRIDPTLSYITNYITKLRNNEMEKITDRKCEIETKLLKDDDDDGVPF